MKISASWVINDGFWTIPKGVLIDIGDIIVWSAIIYVVGKEPVHSIEWQVKIEQVNQYLVSFEKMR